MRKMQTTNTGTEQWSEKECASSSTGTGSLSNCTHRSHQSGQVTTSLCSGCISGTEITKLPLALCLICWDWETSGHTQGPEEAPGRSQVGRRGWHCQCSDHLLHTSAPAGKHRHCNRRYHLGSFPSRARISVLRFIVLPFPSKIPSLPNL